MRYEGQVYRPPSEADSYILQATIGCSWNHCTYCDMYRSKPFRVRALEEILSDLQAARLAFGGDEDALVMDLEHWEAILTTAREVFPRLRRVSAYATALNLTKKTPEALGRLRQLGLSLLYVGPETGDDLTFGRIAKGAGFGDHVVAARRAREAGMSLSAIFLLGVGGTERSRQHAEASARLITEMDPEFLSLLTLTVVPGTPLARLQERERFALPTVEGMLGELRTIVALAEPTDAVFRTNHASNYLPLSGQLPRDRDQILAVVDRALAGAIGLRPEWARGL
jgi:radical SAM superfamily enzyme YgiQ (UPF0313 family)